MPFIDIAFQAEISRYEDAEFDEIAKRNCNECPETRDKIIDELRKMIKGVIESQTSDSLPVNIALATVPKYLENNLNIHERAECDPRRMDDAYLLKFLRCRRFIPALAHKLMVRYEEFRRKYSYLYRCEPFNMGYVNLFLGTFPDNPANGRLIFVRFGDWDAENIKLEDVLRSAVMMIEIATMQPKLQILGVTIIMDLIGVNLRLTKYLSSAVASQIAGMMGMALPVQVHCLHIINNSWIVNSSFYLFKQFVPKTLWNRIHFHNDMKTLQKYIDPVYLPPKYGGTCKHVFSLEEWLLKLNRFKDEFMVKELRYLGYNVHD